MVKKEYTMSSSGAFVELFTLSPYNDGPLGNLTFAVKDNIDIKGLKTSYGSKPWLSAHNTAVYNAVCIEQILASGATCVGKTVADEYTYSLDGESYFYGTPVNPKVPARVPGGSSSGSASAVACGLVDFSIGTDSAGSIRVPASLCGIWGMRPTLHRISEAGVLPFMPSVSTVGAFANDIKVLDKVMRIMLNSDISKAIGPRRVYILEDAFAIADDAVADALKQGITRIFSACDIAIESITLSEVVGEDIDLHSFNTQALRVVQTAEFMNTVGGWIEATNPEKGPGFAVAYENLRGFERSELNDALLLRETLYRRISNFLNPGDLVVFPTTPTIAPLKGTLNNIETVMDFYDRTMAITSFSGVGRLPEISVPLITVDGSPVGLSIASGTYQDEFLLSTVRQLFSQ